MARLGQALKILEEGCRDSYTLDLSDRGGHITCDECGDWIYNGDRVYRRTIGGVTYQYCGRECREATK